ncbi:SDR family NAD(P)-dependent oxidoreductase [Aquimarina sp. MMG016]|uniref:SDR family NAD(P)-dependent oxidoreductase n=1 Tax=Aquimarina sp. MMG016 TaxID=2822690 RepID=UPI001B3A2D09|nr:SDR family NAD(P)-dependent oxidoreductase [Aquimarina sp. MMG016]MBQ4819683.1 SDR family oxidoreductase [Aquimarina sp. MMG016]
MSKLKDKVAIITGGALGIGKATAKLFLDHGAKVMLVDIKEKELKATVEKLNSLLVDYCVADVSKSKDVKHYVAETLKVFGKIDIFFNNAGIEGKSIPMAEYPEDLFDQVIAVNIKGVWLGCQNVIPKMTDGGSVIITSSVAGLKGFKGLGPYVVSKHGELGIMRTAALEFAERGIRVNSVHPGPVHTRMMRSIEKNISPNHPEEAQKGFENLIPFERYAEPEEIANLVLFLASDDSKYMTGTMQVIDGGMLLM